MEKDILKIVPFDMHSTANLPPFLTVANLKLENSVFSKKIAYVFEKLLLFQSHSKANLL